MCKKQGQPSSVSSPTTAPQHHTAGRRRRDDREDHRRRPMNEASAAALLAPVATVVTPSPYPPPRGCPNILRNPSVGMLVSENRPFSGVFHRKRRALIRCSF
ncbi:hypothetical protein TIFTF001_023660 [Ficus carica]|uniref:Uncharacterized protein n=1 Tax=Ficus carica TaxID=3494 RepID=A0AA88B072_FICCA|nr:hypothetical protein TIFTF001_023660 [Ficus carica]